MARLAEHDGRKDAVKRRAITGLLLLAAMLVAADAARAQAAPPSPEQIARMRLIGGIRASIGGSGLRRFLSESASLGELQNRAAAYRIIDRVEGARVAALDGRISALEGALENPALPSSERTRLEMEVDVARTERLAVPAYRAEYLTWTAQAGTLADVAVVGDGVLFVLAKARFARRSGADDYLRVGTGRIDIAPVYAPTSRWLVSLGFTGSYTDVDVLPFDGISRATALGMRFDVGGVLSPNWALGAHGNHTWTSGTTEVTRPGPNPVPVKSRPSTRVWEGKVELAGRFGPDHWRWLPDALRLEPRAGGYLLATGYDEVVDSRGDTSSGPLGASDALAVVAAGLGVVFDAGRFAPSFDVGLDHEVAGNLGDVLADRTGISLSGALWYTITATRRVGVTGTLGRSLAGRRRSGQIDVVGVIDF